MNRIAYLVSDYGAASHTFVRREVAALRALGAEVVPYSVQRTAGGDAASLLGRSSLAYLGALVWCMIAHPLALLRVWALSLRHRPPGLKGLVWSQFHLVEAVLLARLMARAGCKRLHNHFANSGATVGLLASRLLNLPWSLTLHGISESDYPAGFTLPGKIEAADFVACASHFMRAQAMRVVGARHWPKLHVVHCGIDLAALPKVPAKEDAASRLICVGRLSPEKGYFGLFEALASLKADNVQFALTIVGDGPSGPDIKARVIALGLGDAVKFTGALSEQDTLRQIAEADILVLPSLMEGLPVVLIEALALDRMVIASCVAGIPELVRDCETGLLFTPSDWNDLERCLRRALSDQSLQLRCGAEGRKAVDIGFRIEHSAERMAQLFGNGSR